jgi:hypothetical protein
MNPTAKALTALTFFTCVATGALGAGSPQPAAPCPQPGASSDLIGLWEPTHTSKGGIGQTLEFRPNGALVESMTVMVDFRYEIAGDRLTVSPTSPDSGEPTVYTFRVQDDRLIETAKGDPAVEKVRAGKAETDGPPVLGVWSFGQGTRVSGYEKYTRDGRMLLRIPLKSETGCYRVQGDRLTFSRVAGQWGTRTFHQSFGELVLDNPEGGQTLTYRLVADGPWYGLEHSAGGIK